VFVESQNDGRNNLVIVADKRLRSDVDAGSVMRHAVDLREPLDPAYYLNDVTRIALFDTGAEPTVLERAEARRQLQEWLAVHKPKVTLVIPTADVDDGGETQQSSTVCWHAFSAPDSLANMRGCFYEYAPHQYVVPIFPRSPWLKLLQVWQQAHWLTRAKRVADGFAFLLEPLAMVTEISSETAPALSAMTNRTIAVDIESIEGTEKVTAIGISDGASAVSVPWDSFRPHGRGEDEKGIHDYGESARFIISALHWLLSDKQTVKVFHNHTFDVPRLAAIGLKVGGPIHDTFVASGVAYPELRHGLQHAVAREMACPPWKSLWHPRLKGITRDDTEFWTCDPVELRRYNARDAYYTYCLAKKLMPRVGVLL
jgi:hypothetical protein